MNDLQTLARRAAPWRPGFPWWIAVLQGLLAAATGLWIVLATQQSARVATLLLGGWLLVAGVLEVAGTSPDRPAAPLVAARAGAGLLGGLVVVLQPFLAAVDEPAARAVLGVTLAASALGALLGAVLGRSPARARGIAALGALLYATLGWLLFSPEPGGPALWWTGAATGVLGLVLLGYGMALRGRTDRPAATGQDAG